MKRYDNHQYFNQSGFSLIEFMLAMAIGLVVLMIVVQIVVSSRRALDVVHGQLIAQQAGRFSLHFMSHSTRLAGYINASELNTLEGDAYAVEFVNNLAADEQWNGNSTFQSESVIIGSDSTNENLYEASSINDSFSLRLQGSTDTSLLDCSGVAVAPAEISVMTYYIDLNDQLRCYVTDSNASRNVALVEGVHAMQLLYAVSRINQQQKNYGYFNASQMNLDDWRNVIGIKVGLLTRSDNSPTAESAKTIDLLDMTIDVDDGHIYQTYVQTIALRNHLNFR